MRNFLFINQGVVVGVVEKENDFARSDCSSTYDTVAEDPSRTFKVGDIYTPELALEANKDFFDYKKFDESELIDWLKKNRPARVNPPTSV
jgi:hypothetical protein